MQQETNTRLDPTNVKAKEEKPNLPIGARKVWLPVLETEAIVLARKGRSTMEAHKIMNRYGDEGYYLPGLMHLLVRIEGRQEPVEFYLDDLSGTDYDELLLAVQGPEGKKQKAS